MFWVAKLPPSLRDVTGTKEPLPVVGAAKPDVMTTKVIASLRTRTTICMIDRWAEIRLNHENNIGAYKNK
jgi:hypothetical protein